MAKKIKKLSAKLFLPLLMAIAPILAFAQAGAGGQLSDPLNCTGDISTCFLGKIINFLLLIGIPIASIMIIVGGFQLMTASGEPQKVSQGKKTILYAAIGLGVLLVADQIVAFVQNLFK